jgi:sterol desaturase/sphingolipid hydroxylase (fatty acid hydroxylase superfamily)
MVNAILANEHWIRIAMFAGIFAVMAIWEFVAPRRTRAVGRSARWSANLGIVALNSLLVRFVLPTTVVGVATAMEVRGAGLLHIVDLPDWVTFVVAIVLLDLAIYLQHVLFHAVPTLWRLHRMHHADVDVDVTNGLRFHPIEILLSALIKMGVIAVLGAPAAAVVVFEVLLNGLAMFNHSNVNIPDRVDRVLRRLVVTPDMHRIHHSWHTKEHNSNYGFNLSLWDRIFGTYIRYPQEGQENMVLGLRAWREPQWQRLDRMLLQPFIHPEVFNAPLKANHDKNI